MLLDYMIDNNSLDILPEERKLVQSLIKGTVEPYTDKNFFYYPWIYQIVSNKKNSIDVDKFDYINRDAYHIGYQSSSVDYERIFNTSKIINNNLCFNIKVTYLINELNKLE